MRGRFRPTTSDDQPWLITSDHERRSTMVDHERRRRSEGEAMLVGRKDVIEHETTNLTLFRERVYLTVTKP